MDATRMMEWERLMSYPNKPRDTAGQKSCTFLAMEWNRTQKEMNRYSRWSIGNELHEQVKHMEWWCMPLAG